MPRADHQWVLTLTGRLSSTTLCREPGWRRVLPTSLPAGGSARHELLSFSASHATVATPSSYSLLLRSLNEIAPHFSS